MTDPYATLCVPPGASADDIKASYRRLSRAHHPDHGGDAARFRELAAAYEVLGDPERRREHDAAREKTSVLDDVLRGIFGGGQASVETRNLAEALARIAADADEAKRCAGDCANLVDIIRECGALGVDQGLQPSEGDDGDIVQLRAGLVALGDWFRGGNGASPLESAPEPRADRRRRKKERA